MANPIYAPITKGMTNDLKAIAKMSDAARAVTKPLVELANFAQYATPDDAVEAFISRLVKTPTHGPVFVDLYGLPPSAVMADGTIATVAGFARLRQSAVVATPVFGFGINDSVWRPLAPIVSELNQGFCFRIDLEDLDDQAEDTWQQILERSAAMGLGPASVDLLIDLRSMHNRNVKAAQTQIVEFLLLKPRRFEPRQVILGGSSALRHVGPVPQNESMAVQRTEINLWAQVQADVYGNMAIAFADYGVVHPDFSQSGPNPNTNGKIRYTSGKSIHYFRGSKLRAPPGFQQYHTLAERVTGSAIYCGANFSEGDRTMDLCARRASGTGNLSTWVFADQNHHFEYSVQQVTRLNSVLESADSAEDVDEAIEATA